MTGATCILISTCEKYRPLAEWTASRIDHLWRDHPPLFFSGLRPVSSRHLSYDCDERDWFGVNLAAVRQLIDQGHRWCYLILDDLPPMSTCHAEFLNRTLPDQAQLLDATMVSLLGWGQHRYVEGKILPDHLSLERIPGESKWRFSLHPGLWRLDRLQQVLEVRSKQFEPDQRTAWNFERHHATDLHDFPQSILHSCYRVHGRSAVNERTTWLNDLIQTIGCFVFDVALFLVRVTRGNAARQQAAARWLWPYCYYRGPFPLFWSGVMRQGKVSREWTEFLKYFNPSGIREEWEIVRKTL